MVERLAQMDPDFGSLPESQGGAGRSAFDVRPWHVICLAIIVLVGGFLRFYRIEATSVWCDELLSIHISNAHNFSVDRLPRGVLIRDVPDLMSLSTAQPAWKVWSRMGGDMHPPLYYLTLRLWREVFGDSPIGIRSLSAVLGTLALLAVFFAGREMAGTAVGLWAAALNMAAADHIYYSQEARMYALAMLLTTAAIAVVFRLERFGFTYRRGAALAVCSVGAMLTLYLSSTVLVAAALYAAIRFRSRLRLNTIGTFVVAALAFALLWLPFLMTQEFHALKSDWLKTSPVGLVAITFDRIALLPMTHFAVPLPAGNTYAYIFAIVYVIPLLFVRKCPAILLPLLAVTLVAGIPAAADLIRTTNMLMWSRYTVLMVPALSLSIATLSWQLPSRLRWVLPASLVLFCVISLPAVYEKERYDFRNVTKGAEKAFLSTGGPIVLMSTWNEKFDSVLLLSMQYYWKTPVRDVVFVESEADFNRLPHDVTKDRLVLFAGDAFPQFAGIRGFVREAGGTWAVGVGTVDTLRASDPATTTTPSTFP